MEFRFACEVCSSINPQLSTINQSELPRGVIRSAPVSDTGWWPCASTLEQNQARQPILQTLRDDSIQRKKQRTNTFLAQSAVGRVQTLYERHSEQDDCAG